MGTYLGGGARENIKGVKPKAGVLGGGSLASSLLSRSTITSRGERFAPRYAAARL